MTTDAEDLGYAVTLLSVLTLIVVCFGREDTGDPLLGRGRSRNSLRGGGGSGPEFFEGGGGGG